MDGRERVKLEPLKARKMSCLSSSARLSPNSRTKHFRSPEKGRTSLAQERIGAARSARHAG